jgi:soluble lytic murein transglycosylase-like protein
MLLFRPRQRAEFSTSTGIMGELERLGRRMRAAPLAAPILLAVGLGAGQVTSRALAVDVTEAVREVTEKEAPPGHLEAISDRMNAMSADGDRTVEYVTMYREHVQPVETVLRRHGISRAIARKISWPLVEQSYEKGLDPATVVSVVLIESGGKPTARSFVGAQGLMQVMPLWIGTWRQCGMDLYNVKDNLCNGTSILAYYLRRHGTERAALLGYNGCVRGTNTPNCHTYPDKIWKLREQIKKEIVREKAKVVRTQAD